jgi:hypothetical protein
MRYTWLLLAIGLTVVGSGCSSRREMTPEEKPRFMRQMVIASVRLAREQPTRVAERSELYIERLKEVKAQNLDDNGPVYDGLIRKYQELGEAARRSPGSAEVNKKLGELSELAKKLPM